MKANHDTLTGYQAWLRAAEALGNRERQFTELCEAQIESARSEIGQIMTVAQMAGNDDQSALKIVGYTFLYDPESEEIEVTGLRAEDSEGVDHEFDFPFPATVAPTTTTKRRSAKGKS